MHINGLTQENISGKVLDHLGLVAATIHKIGLIDKVDALLPLDKNKGAKTTMGQRIAAMILNGLGFLDTRLYMFPEFLQNKPVNRLFDDDVSSDLFNDDALGRCLDAVHEFGVNSFFSQLAFPIGLENNFIGCNINLDTSSLSLHGTYPDQKDLAIQPADSVDSSQDNNLAKTPYLTHGFSKDHRPDLKQVVINMATTGASAFPVWLEIHSGNASDKKILHESAERMQSFCKTIKDAPTFMYVADSAMAAYLFHDELLICCCVCRSHLR